MAEDLILLHGALGSSAQMRPLADRLQRPATCPDFHGHGVHSGDERAYSIVGFANDVASLISAPTDIIGYSMGGYVALYVAAMFPQKVRSVVTIATKFDWTPEGAAAEVRMLDPDKVRQKVPSFASLLEKRHGVHWPQVMERTAAMMLRLGDSPVLGPEMLGKVNCPVLLIRGSEDTMVTEAETAWAKARIRDANLMTLAGQQHPIERMDLGLLASVIKAEAGI